MVLRIENLTYGKMVEVPSTSRPSHFDSCQSLTEGYDVDTILPETPNPIFVSVVEQGTNCPSSILAALRSQREGGMVNWQKLNPGEVMLLGEPPKIKVVAK